MSKKLQGNGLWESSRMMLPEHKSTILKRNQEFKRLSKPVLHEDEIIDINHLINESYHGKEVIHVRIHGDWGNREIVGVVTQINSYQKKIKLDFDEGFEWVDFDEIVSIAID